MQGRRRKASAAVIFQRLNIQLGVVHDIMLANLAFKAIGGQVEERRDGDDPAQAVLEDQSGRGPGGAGTLVHDAVGRLDFASPHIAESGPAVLAVGSFMG